MGKTTMARTVVTIFGTSVVVVAGTRIPPPTSEDGDRMARLVTDGEPPANLTMAGPPVDSMAVTSGAAIRVLPVSFGELPPI